MVRVAGFATGIRRSLMPALVELATSSPGIAVRMSEYEPLEALDLLGRDDLDLALVYDYNLAPAALRNDLTARELWSIQWGLAVPSPGPASAVLDVRRPRLDRELPPHRRRGRPPHPGVHGRVHAPDRAPDRQPRDGRGPDRGRSRHRPAATRAHHQAGRARPAPHRPDRHHARVRRDPAWARAVATAARRPRTPVSRSGRRSPERDARPVWAIAARVVDGDREWGCEGGT